MAQGVKTGGRQRGTPNRATIERQIRAAHGVQQAGDEGILPLDVMLCRMRNIPLPNGLMATDAQFEAAVVAAPYLHPRLAATTLQADVTVSAADEERRREVRQKVMQELSDLARPAPLPGGV